MSPLILFYVYILNRLNNPWIMCMCMCMCSIAKKKKKACTGKFMMWPWGRETQKNIHPICKSSRNPNAAHGRLWPCFCSATFSLPSPTKLQKERRLCRRAER